MTYEGRDYTEEGLMNHLIEVEGYDEDQAWEIVRTCPCAAKSPYVKYRKQAFDYVHPRCGHAHTHPETFAVGEDRDRRRVRVQVCDVCNIIQGRPELLAKTTHSFRRAA